MTTKVDPQAPQQIKKAVNLSSLFQARLAETPKKPLPPPQETIEEKLPEKEKIC